MRARWVGIDPDVLAAGAGNFGAQAAAAGTGAQPLPVAGGEGAAGEGGTVHEGFHQQGPAAVAVLPVLGEAGHGQVQDFGGEILTVDLGANQQAGQADDAAELGGAGGGGPADPVVARGQAEGGGAEAHGAQPAVFAADEVAGLGAGQRRGAAGMLLDEEIVPDAVERVVRASEPVEMEAAHAVHLTGDAGAGRQGLAGGAQALRAAGAAGRAGGGEQAALFQFIQGHLGAGEGRSAGGGKPVAGGAERAGLGDFAGPGIGRPEVVEVGQEFGGEGFAAEADGFVHGRRLPPGREFV